MGTSHGRVVCTRWGQRWGRSLVCAVTQPRPLSIPWGKVFDSLFSILLLDNTRTPALIVSAPTSPFRCRLEGRGILRRASVMRSPARRSIELLLGYDVWLNSAAVPFGRLRVLGFAAPDEPNSQSSEDQRASHTDDDADYHPGLVAPARARVPSSPTGAVGTVRGQAGQRVVASESAKTPDMVSQMEWVARDATDAA